MATPSSGSRRVNWRGGAEKRACRKSGQGWSVGHVREAGFLTVLGVGRRDIVKRATRDKRTCIWSVGLVVMAGVLASGRSAAAEIVEICNDGSGGRYATHVRERCRNGETLVARKDLEKEDPGSAMLLRRSRDQDGTPTQGGSGRLVQVPWEPHRPPKPPRCGPCIDACPVDSLENLERCVDACLDSGCTRDDGTVAKDSK